MPEPADVHFLETAATLVPSGAPAPPGAPNAERCLELFDAQLGSRHLDLAARRLQAQGHGFYTIGSSGHEGNAAVAGALRPDDPALLHYRSGAFFLERARQVPGRNPLRDVLLGLVAAAEEPIAGGRHKVFGSRPLNVIPQTSTIASHLPRALGVAFAIERAARLGLDSPWPRDAVTVCSFGDASANHSTAAGAVNAAVNCGYQGLPLPLLLVCEDNGIGISVPTAPGWIEAAYGSRPGLAYFPADGCDLADAHAAAARAAGWVRERRRPAFLHLRTVRLMGHAGSDVESSYRTPAEMASDLERDPLLRTARLLVDRGAATARDIVGLYEAKRAEVTALAEKVAGAPRLASAPQVMAPLRYPRPGGRARRADGEPVTVAQAINRTLGELLDERPGMLVFGEDVARKGGVYGVTRGLVKRAGAARVFDTILDEQSILGLALGFGISGMLPVPEIQYLAYLHNAADQLRGEAATLPFFSSGRYRNPMVVRIAGYAYQKGFGGHFHNDNAVAALRDIPGLVIASPSRPDDAAGMLRACADAAEHEGRVCAMLEPIALYHARDLHEDGDGGWLAPAGGTVPIGRARTYGDGGDLTVVTFANGLRMSLRAARRLEAGGVRCRVLDLRWLAPLPVEDLLREARATGAVLVADETRRTGGVSEGVLTALADAGFPGRAARVTSEDSFIPLGDAAYHVLLSEAAIEEAARRLLTSPR
ncbi:2-oxoisovalerate dehydrogenase E1 component [Actinomadura luteofluorescens]|uniref:2-oxoisovalerate dehydrogenase E1 component n=1 Tax=Actinomadura luteofluorescens TaxID=46163 RepID=A0A7Y9JKS3_9ACTN|nr:thiamine pyrophosphate-dependent enzyme [Actinomadura luteofluorescens]NYD52645.1 2-oxoisovalerate dehydrogenase E1 component [Actinomadura luteofluorescens]